MAYTEIETTAWPNNDRCISYPSYIITKFGIITVFWCYLWSQIEFLPNLQDETERLLSLEKNIQIRTKHEPHLSIISGVN